MIAWQFGGDVRPQTAGLYGYVMTWGGSLFRALSGGALGYVISRHVLDLDLSQIAEERRRPIGMDVYLSVDRHAEYVDPQS